MSTLIIATRNAHKVEEIMAVLPASISCLSLAGIPGVPDIVEDGATFQANAALKCLGVGRHLASSPEVAALRKDWGEWAVLADDSGLEVDALGGAPGVRSARFAAGEDSSIVGNTPDSANNAKLLRLLKTIPDERRGARFRCVLAWSRVGLEGAMGNPLFFEGVCEGRILLAPSGGGGFGYDPLFAPLGHDRSFAELGAESKNQLSHRAAALARLRAVISRDTCPPIPEAR
ncbi:MAG: non-canonical purine NTP pyrophosphatase [Verrucomicrobia bacterium]|nr:non-canonical purine NTP pyrophosphatase [Verrucomicrobiota bacterium]MBI3870673.1 non-canonical purine NTP pyrophosphatase [Verrucomicrobiota bacterium]